MKFNVLRSVAATLSLGVCTIASAQYGPNPYAGPTSQLGIPQTQSVQTYGNPNQYQAPAKWSNFGAPSNGPALFQPASTGGHNAQLPMQAESIPTPSPSAQYSAPAAQYSAPAVQQHAPVAQHHAPVAQHSTQLQPGQVHVGAPVDDSYCQSCNQAPAPAQSVFVQAAAQPWEGVQYSAPAMSYAPTRAPLFPWFGSFDLLFFNMDSNGKDRNVVSRYSAADPTRPYLPYMGIGSLDPNSSLGYQLNVGRYFGCGQYGAGIGYFNWNPDEEVFNSPVYAPLTTAAGGGNLRASGMPQYHAATMIYEFDNGAGAGYQQIWGDSNVGDQAAGGVDDYHNVYDVIDGRAGASAVGAGDLTAADGGAGAESFAEAVLFQARRDVDVQGLEVNLFCFGLMGAQRASAATCGGGGCGAGGGLRSFLGMGGNYGGVGGYGGGYGNCNTGCQPCGQQCAPQCQPCGPRFGFGGAGGPLVRPCNGKVQVVTSHGLRWFQFRDSLDYAYDIDGRAGFGDNDLYDTTSADNDLFGYQFGSRLTYCLGSRVNLNLGGKFGLYGNQAEFRHRLGTATRAAHLAAMPGEEINYTSKDTVLSTLGELDLGLGVRVSNAWTLRGGYRVMGVTGLATADDYERDYSSVASASAMHANSSLLLHGAYVGADFNW